MASQTAAGMQFATILGWQNNAIDGGTFHITKCGVKKKLGRINSFDDSDCQVHTCHKASAEMSITSDC